MDKKMNDFMLKLFAFRSNYILSTQIIFISEPMLTIFIISKFYFSIFFIYTLFNEGKTHLANINIFYHVALSNKLNIYLPIRSAYKSISSSYRLV